MESVGPDNPDSSSEQTIDLQLLKKEVDALQVAVFSEKAPWFRSSSTIISIIALLFSFGTTFVSYARTQSQDIQSSRIELRGLLQRLASLPKENMELAKKYENDPLAVASASGFINSENALLARQAAEVIQRIPAEYVSSTEYMSVGIALQNSYNIDGAMVLFTRAVDESKDLSDRVSALRQRANLLFLMGQPEAGRVDYQRALNVFSGSANVYNDFIMKSTHIWTELGWASAEAGIGQQDTAMQHIAAAQSQLLGLLPGPGTTQLKGLVDQTRSLVLGTGAAPAARTLPLVPTPIEHQR